MEDSVGQVHYWDHRGGGLTNRFHENKQNSFRCWYFTLLCLGGCLVFHHWFAITLSIQTLYSTTIWFDFDSGLFYFDEKKTKISHPNMKAHLPAFENKETHRTRRAQNLNQPTRGFCFDFVEQQQRRPSPGMAGVFPFAIALSILIQLAGE